MELMVSSSEALYFCRIKMDGSISFCSRVKTHFYAFFVRFLSKAHLHSSSCSKNVASTNSQFLLACLFFPHWLSKHYKQSQQKQTYIGITTFHNGSASVVMPTWGRDCTILAGNVEKIKPSHISNWGI